MFTDIVGYSSLANTDEPLALRLLQEQSEILRPIIGGHRGRVVKSTGDGMLVEFESALRATHCAFDMQERLHERNLQPGPPPLRVRIGIHLGDVEERESDILGDAVNIAARIEPLADPDGICVSAQVYDQIHNKVSYRLEKLPTRPLKGIRNSVEVYRLALPWLPPAAPSEPLTKNRVAVLPFTNISPNPNDAYIADGMTEELIATMSKIRGLGVLSRTAVMRYRSEQRSLDEIAKDLKVGTILEGSVRKAGEKIRITVQAVDAESGVHLWAESYDRDMRDLFAIEAEISQSVADNLKVKLLEEEKTRIRTEPTRNSEAHAFFLRGVAYNTTEFAREASLRDSIRCFQRAIELDPAYAGAHAWLADSLLSLYLLGGMSADEAFSQAGRAVTRALELDPDLADAHASLSALKFYHGDMEGAEAELHRAIGVNPNDNWHHSYYAALLMVLGRYVQAEEEARTALDLAPLDAYANWALFNTLVRQRRYPEALAHLTEMRERDPRMVDGPEADVWRDGLGEYYMGTADFEKAIEEFDRLANRSSIRERGADSSLANLGWALARGGRQKEAARILDGLDESAKSRRVSTGARTEIQVALGRLEDAFTLCERAGQTSTQLEVKALVRWLRTHPVYDALRSDPRFVALLSRLETAGRSASGSVD